MSHQVDTTACDPAHTIVVATGNAHKLVEIETILSRALPDARFVSIKELGDFADPEEDGATFVENALIKARAAVAETGLPAVADDSGLMVDALGGEPGVYSARYAGVHGDDAANNAKLIANMTAAPESQRTARFASAVALVYPDGTALVGEGACEGSIAFESRGSNGFGYDPYFLPAATPGRTMAELEPEEKNAISHRYFALCALCDRIAQRASDMASDAGTAADAPVANAPAALDDASSYQPEGRR